MIAAKPMLRVALGAVLLTGFGCGGGDTAKKPPKLDPQQEFRQQMGLAESYFKAGRTSEAIEVAEKAATANPGNAAAWNFHGQLCFVAGRLPAAEQSFRKALAIDPYLSDAQNNLGAVLDRTGRKTEAEEAYRKAIADPTYPTPEKVYLNLGLLFASQGRDDDAVAEMRRAVELNPKFYQGHYELASLLDRTGRLDEAVRLYEVASPEYRNDGTYHYRLGLAYFRLKRNDDARRHLEKVLEVAPGSENAAKSDDLLKLMR